MAHTLFVAVLVGAVSLLYATAGQAGGTAFLAIMSFTGFPAAEMRPTALLLNIVAAGYATWRLSRRNALDWKLLLPLTVPSLVTAFVGGLLVLRGPLYFFLTGLLLIAAVGLTLVKRGADTILVRPIRLLPGSLVGAGAGLLSGLTGVGGGVFLTPQLIAFGWASPKRAAALSPPFILCNSALGLMGVLLAGQRAAPGVALYATGALAGAILGTAVGLRWMSQRATRYTLAAILLFAGIRLVFR
jgi:uncharacterized membrane protein YfcA